MKNPIDILDNQINTLLTTLEKNNVTIQFEDPQSIINFLQSYNKIVLDDFFINHLKNSIQNVEFLICIEHQKLHDTKCVVNTPYVFENNLNTIMSDHVKFIEYCFGDTINYNKENGVEITWKGRELFVDEKLKSLGYYVAQHNFLPDSIENFYKNSLLDYSIVDFLKSVENKIYPYQVIFAHSKNDPSNYKFLYLIDEYLNKDLQNYDAYFGMKGLFKYFQSENFSNNEIIVNFCTTNEIYLQMEIPVQMQKEDKFAEKYLLRMSEYINLSDQMVKNIQQLKVPEKIDSFSVLLTWNSPEKMKVDLSMRSFDSEFIKSLL